MALGLGTICLGVVQGMYLVIPPTVGWPIVAMLFIGAISLCIIGIRKKEGQKESFVSTIDFHAWAIGISGYRGYPQKPDNAYWLYLEISTNQSIDTLDLLIGDRYIAANLPCRFSHIFNAYFKVTEWRYTGEHQVELIVNKARNNSISSGRKPIDFNMEPFGRHPT